MNVLQWVLRIDRSLYRILHDCCRSQFMDALMDTLSSRRSWLPVILVISVITIIIKRVKFLEIAVIIAVAVGLSDFTACQLIKPAVGRERPEPSSSYAFPSGHAASSTSAATVLAFYVPPLAPAAAASALAISCSRIYLGAHYPLDVFCGALLGFLIACAVLRLRQRVFAPDRQNIITWWKQKNSPIQTGEEKHEPNQRS